MRRSDIEAVGGLAGDALAAGGTLIKEMHQGIAERPFGILGIAAAPVRLIHDGISRAVYDGLLGALRATRPPIECPTRAICSTVTGHASATSSSSSASERPFSEMRRPVL